MYSKLRLINLKLKMIFSLAIVALIFSRCAEEELLNLEPATVDSSSSLAVTEATATAVPFDCAKCKYIVPENTNLIDGAKLGLKPGDVVCLSASKKYSGTPLRFINFAGAASNPIVITNCGGPVSVTVPNSLTYVAKFENSKYVRLTGGSTDGAYGLKFSGSAILGVSMDKLTTNFEIDHIEVSNVGFAGIMAKTDPTCDDATIRGNFTLRDAFIHHNYVHDTGGEGLYIGNSFYKNGVSTSCGIRYPHSLENIKIYRNIVKNTGWEAIQLGGAIKGAEINDNVVENYGTVNIGGQNNGIQVGEGTGGLCYNNYVKYGPGSGIIVLGFGDNVVFNNIIINAGASGIFCDDRYTPGPGFKFLNNTIVNPKGDGLRIYADLPTLNNVVKNNLIANTGTFNTYETDTTPRTGQDSYVYLLNSNTKVTMSNNWFTRNTQVANYLVLGSFNPILTTYCYVADRGTNCSADGVTTDFLGKPRPAGAAYDIGAVEYK